MAAKKKKDDSKKPKVHKDLEGFNFDINSFGEVSGSMDIDSINEFLNKNVEDKKLTEKEEKENKKAGK